MITIIENQLIKHYVTILRDKNTKSAEFRSCAKKVGYLLAYQAFDSLTLDDIEVHTPLELTSGYKVNQDVVVVPVLRAGTALLDAFTEVYPDANVAFVGVRRNEHTFEAEEYLFSFPKIKPNTKIILLEMMIATGGTTGGAISRIKFEGAQDITVCAVISAPEGIEQIRAEHPDVKIISATLDRELNHVKYILPGLGDAGDRWCGDLF